MKKGWLIFTIFGVFSGVLYADGLLCEYRGYVGFVNTNQDVRDVVFNDTFAYLAVADGGILVIDIQCPESPEQVGVFASEWDAVGLFLQGAVLTIACGNDGVVIYDVADPLNPVLLGRHDTGGAVNVVVQDGIAFIADSFFGMKIVDVSDPALSVELASVLVGRVEDVVVSGDLVYVASWGAGLAVYDVSDLASPVRLSRYLTNGSAIGLAVVNDIAYVAVNESGLETIDVSNPKSMVHLGQVDTDGFATDLVVRDSTVYLADAYGGLKAIDVSDPVNPAVVSAYQTPGRSYEIAIFDGLISIVCGDSGMHILEDFEGDGAGAMANNYQLSFGASVLVHEDGKLYASVATGIAIFDVSDPSTPVLLGELNLSASGAGMYLQDNRLYIVAGYDGLFVIDVSVPSAPLLLGSIKDVLYYNTCVFVEQPFAYLGDDAGMVRVVDVTDPSAMQVVGEIDTYGSPETIQIVDSIMYVGENRFERGLEIFDVSDPLRSVYMSSISTPHWVGGIEYDQGYLYMATGSGGLVVADVSDPFQPTILSRFDTLFSAIDLDYHYGKVFLLDTYAGLVVFDVSDPQNPVWKGAQATAGSPQALVVLDDIALVSDRFQFPSLEAGIKIINVHDCDLCAADYTHDGRVNFFDLSAYLQLFAAQDPVADLTGDERWNFFDISIFLQDFAAGCP